MSETVLNKDVCYIITPKYKYKEKEKRKKPKIKNKGVRICPVCYKRLRNPTPRQKYCKSHSKSEINAYVKNKSYERNKDLAKRINNEFKELYETEGTYIVVGTGSNSTKAVNALGQLDLSSSTDNNHYNKLFVNPDDYSKYFPHLPFMFNDWRDEANRLKKIIIEVNKYNKDLANIYYTKSKNTVKLNEFISQLYFNDGKWTFEIVDNYHYTNASKLGTVKLWLFEYEAIAILTGNPRLIQQIINPKPYKEYQYRPYTLI